MLALLARCVSRSYKWPRCAPLLFFLIILSCFTGGTLKAQCCTNGVNLLANYNPDFLDTFSTVPPGFTNSNIYAAHPTGAGYYYIMISRNYGACGATPEYDHVYGDSMGRYVWFDTPSWASETDPAVAWEPYNPLLPAGQQNLIAVTPNTTYVFSIWVRDLARDDDCVSGGAPIAGIRINGVDMGEINLGLITTPCCPAWTNLCTLWNSGTDTTALLKIESRTGIGWTDLGIDDVYFGVQTPGGPVLSISPDTTVCTGDTVLLEASLINATFLWSNGSNDSFTRVTAPGAYWVEAWQGNCVLTDTVLVAQKTFQPVTLVHDTSLCSGSSIVLNAYMPGASYLWQDSSTNATYTVTQGGTYRVSITDSNCVAVDTTHVGLLTVAPVYITSDTDVICPGDTALICAPSGYTAYLWNNGATTNCVSATLQGSYFVQATDSSGCAATSNHVPVTELHPPVVSITGSDSISACSADSVQLCTQPGYAIYTWNTGQSTYCINAHNAGLYIVTVTDFNGCSSTTSDSLIAAGGAAPVHITSNKTNMCPGDTAIICATAGYVLYQWNTGDTGVCVHTPFEGEYYVTVTENGNCTAVSNHVQLNIYPPSPVTVSINGDTLKGYTAQSYQWFLNGAAISGATSAVYIATGAGTYILQVTDTNGCHASSTPITVTGLGEISWDERFTIYPNPTNAGWQLRIDGEIPPSNIELFDATGRMVFRHSLANAREEINLPAAASGIYELRINSGQYSLVRKLVKL